MSFIPCKDDFFYVAVKPFTRVVESFDKQTGFPVVERIQSVDRSYNDKIFKCLARDDTAVIGMLVAGVSYGSPEYLFKQDIHQFAPVGPEVLKHFNLVENIKND